MGKLTAAKIKGLKEAGNYTDGEGLRLKVSKSGTKSWLFRYRINGRARDMGLGTYPLRSLQDARNKALELRKLVLDDIDPLVERDRQRKHAEEAEEWTFDKCAAEYHDRKKAGWSQRHGRVWIRSMEIHCSPVIGHIPVADIDTAHVLSVLDPLWTKQPVLASALRERIQKVLSLAAVRGYRERGLNPAAWADNLEHEFARKSDIHTVKHRPAMAYQEIAAFMEELRSVDNLASKALQFTILTACRRGEAVGAHWREIDGDVWSIPMERMKTEADHRVPLSTQAVALLKSLPRRDGYLFPSERYGWQRPMGLSQMLRLMRTLRDHETVHGFRSTFRDWSEEQTAFPWAAKELSLAHNVGSDSEQAYRRSDLLEKRRLLMQSWADHCDRVTADVVGIRA